MNTKVMSVDPGQMTGYAFGELTENGLLELQKPIQAMDEVDDCWRRIEAFKPRYIVCEDFEYRNRARSGLVLFSVQLIGVVRLYELLGTHQCAAFLQKAATGKGYYTDNVLKQSGLHIRGLPHGMDALRHLLQWCTFGYGNQFISSKTRDFAKYV